MMANRLQGEGDISTVIPSDGFTARISYRGWQVVFGGTSSHSGTAEVLFKHNPCPEHNVSSVCRSLRAGSTTKNI